MWTDSLGLSSWTLRQVWFSIPSSSLMTPILEPFHPLPKLSSASAFQPGGTQPMTKDPWGSRAWTYATWGSLHRQSLFQNPCWVGWGFLRSASRSHGFTSCFTLLLFYSGCLPLPQPPTPPPKMKLPPTSISAWVSQRAQLMQLKNHP